MDDQNKHKLYFILDNKLNQVEDKLLTRRVAKIFITMCPTAGLPDLFINHFTRKMCRLIENRDPGYKYF